MWCVVYLYEICLVQSGKENSLNHVFSKMYCGLRFQRIYNTTFRIILSDRIKSSTLYAALYILDSVFTKIVYLKEKLQPLGWGVEEVIITYVWDITAVRHYLLFIEN